MNKFLKITIIFLCIIHLGLVPLLAKAGIVPCGGTDENGATQPACQLCHLFVLIGKIIEFIMTYIIPLAVVFIVIGGILILISRGAELATQGKRMITYAIIGIVIALLAWTIINTIMVALIPDQRFPMPWNRIEIQNCPTVTIDLEKALVTSYTYLSGGVSSTPLEKTEKENNSLFVRFFKKFFNSIIKESSAQIDRDLGVSIGSAIRYTATYTNISPEDLSNLIISIDYDENQIDSITDVSSGGVDDGNKIIWDINDLDTNQSITVYFDFVLSSDISIFLRQTKNDQNNHLDQILKKIFKSASAQIQPITTTHYYNLITISSNEAVTESLNDPLQIRLPVGLFAERQYYLIKDLDGDGLAGIGDKLRYNIRYYNPTPYSFNNAVIVSDYDQNFVTVTSVEGGVDDGNKITWNLGNLTEGEPPISSPECIGYEFIIDQRPTAIIANIFYIIHEEGLLETHNDYFHIE